MSNSRSRYNGKIGYCDKSDLPFKAKTGHYVYIRRYNKRTGKCVVSTCTSLEANGNIKKNKADAIKNGNLYPIPLKDSNFSVWTGINKTKHHVDAKKIKGIGKKSFKRRHHFILNRDK